MKTLTIVLASLTMMVGVGQGQGIVESQVDSTSQVHVALFDSFLASGLLVKWYGVTEYPHGDTVEVFYRHSTGVFRLDSTWVEDNSRFLEPGCHTLEMRYKLYVEWVPIMEDVIVGYFVPESTADRQRMGDWRVR